MPKSLVIVESPVKAKTINKYLGKQYVVKASLGHIKDLPKKDLAVDIEHGFEPRYEIIEGKRKLLSELKQAAKGMESIYLAADPDREGEAICSHLQEELQGDHQERHSESFSKPRHGGREAGGRAAGAPRARPPGGLQDLPVVMG
jgi:DNA topoisomerase-1